MVKNIRNALAGPATSLQILDIPEEKFHPVPERPEGRFLLMGAGVF
jgi:hypothetical protein